MRILLIACLLACWAAPGYAQESRLASDIRRERERIAENCTDLTLKKTVSCAHTLLTDYPFHIAVGSLAPRNGVALGLAFVERYTPNEQWRLSWNADAVGAFSGSWRTGAYMKIVHTPERQIGVVQPGAPLSSSGGIRPSTVYDVYAQVISLKNLTYFGIGNDTADSSRSGFRERQTIVGARVIHPISARRFDGVRPALIGSINLRSVAIAGNTVDEMPSIAALYNEQSAPGLSQQPVFFQVEEGVRLRPALASGRLHLNYLFTLHQFFGENHSFHRWTVDLNHEIPLYGTSASTGPSELNGPNECFSGGAGAGCPPVTFSRNRRGAIGVRLLAQSAMPFSDNRVPFYFQPTLGGRDIDGQRLLASFDDYRFRGPHLVALQEQIEHSLWDPLGVYFMAEQGQVSASRSVLGWGEFHTSYAIGLTVRAGGFPVVNISYARGSGQSRWLAAIDTSLLGGSSRPSLR